MEENRYKQETAYMTATVKISILKRSPDSRSAYFHREGVRNRVQLQVRVEKIAMANIAERSLRMGKQTFFKMTSLVLLLAMLTIMAAGCMTNRHTIGKGPQIGDSSTTRQWYALWGLVNLGNADSKEIAGDATDYRVETYYGVADWFINFFLGWLSIRSRTVKVIK